MSNTATTFKKTSLVLITVALIGVVAVSWWGAGIIVNKPIAERPNFCIVKSRLCLKNQLEELALTEVKIEVELTSFDDTTLKGLYFPSRNSAAIIVQHGYGGHSGSVLHIAKMFYQQGFGVLTMDLRAHGRSGGELVTFGRDEAKDMQYAFDYLASRKEVDTDKIGLYGWSLGGATVLLHGARNSGVKAVVTDSPFDAVNVENMKQFTDTPWPMPALITFFTGLRSGVDFETNSPIANLDAYKTKPLFILIAGNDTVVDPESGERLVQALKALSPSLNSNQQITVWREHSFEHVRFSFDAPEKFSKDIGEFFKRHLEPIEFQQINH